MNERVSYPSIDKPWLKYYSREAIEAPLPEGSMYSYLRSRSANVSHSNAINFFGRKITYEELFRRIDECACALVAAGVKPGDYVACSLLVVPEAAVLLYALNKIGAICVCIAVTDTDREMREKIIRSKCCLMFVQDLFLEKAKATVKGMRTELIAIPLWESAPLATAFLMRLKRRGGMAGVSWKEFLSKRTTIPDGVEPGTGDVAALLYTGGTTGDPKGVAVSNQAANVVAGYYSCGVFDFEPGQRFLDVMPPFLAYGLFAGIHMPLCLGMETVMCPDVSPAAFSGHIRKYRPHHVTTGNPHLDAMMHDARISGMDLSFLQTAGYGGDGASPEWESSLTDFLISHGAPRGVMKGYGMTELAGPFCSSNHRCNRMIPFPHSEVMICDVETGRELGYGKEGEICVSGPALMTGYFDDLQATSEVMFVRNGTRWMKTGDLGMIHENGTFSISGRLKRLLYANVPDGGVVRVYPAEIERMICRHPLVERCTAVGRESDDGFDVVAFAVLAPGVSYDDTLPLLEAYCREHLSPASVPAEIRFLGALPMTNVGKVDYRELERRAAE